MASGGHSSLRCAGPSLSRPLLLPSTGSRRAGSVIVAHGLCRSAACGILPGQGSNPCPLHWQADSQPLCHQGSPVSPFVLFRPSTDWMRPTHIREGSLLYCLPIQMLILSKNRITDTPRIMFDQMSECLVAQSR